MGERRPIGLVLLALTVVACSTGRSSPPPAPPTAGSRASTTTATTTTTVPCSNAAVVARWPLARRAAQLLAIPALDGNIDGLDAVVSLGVGGILLLGGATPADLRQQIDRADRLSAVRPFVMADEEGGGVQRLAGLVPSLPWPRRMAATMTPAQVKAAAAAVARRMAALGVDMDLAPVVDVDGGAGPNASDPDGDRSFSAQPSTASSYGVAFLGGLLQGGVTPVVKHFPGLGGATGNTDEGSASTPPLAALLGRGLIPFEAAVAAGAPAVMISNAAVPGLTTQPASLSSAAIQGLLEGRLGFHGLVLTDSLSARSISAAGYDLPGAAVAAVEAGADMVLFGSTLTAAETALLRPGNVATSTAGAIGALVAAAQNGTLPTSRVNDAVLAVLEAKGTDLCGL